MDFPAPRGFSGVREPPAPGSWSGDQAPTRVQRAQVGSQARFPAAADISADPGPGGAAFLGALPALTGLAATGTIGYAVYRTSVSPSLRRSLSAALREVDSLLAKKSLGNDMRKALQTDRAMLVEVMKLPTAPEGADDEGTIDE